VIFIKRFVQALNTSFVRNIMTVKCICRLCLTTRHDNLYGLEWEKYVLPFDLSLTFESFQFAIFFMARSFKDTKKNITEYSKFILFDNRLKFYYSNTPSVKMLLLKLNHCLRVKQKRYLLLLNSVALTTFWHEN
jgi:hypothetical protein